MRPIEAVASTTLNVVSRVSGPLAGAGAFSLFHMPFVRSKLRSSERELFAQAEVERLPAADGKQAVVYRWGDGSRPVLLVHGWQSRGSRLSAFVQPLRDQGHSVITFDAPGHGDAAGRSTTILDYRAVITALHDKYGTFDALIAHSLGVLASFFALTRGAEAEKVVAISPVCDFEYLIGEFFTELRLRDALQDRLRGQIAKNLFPDLPAERMPFSVTHATEHVGAPVLVIHDEGDTRIEIAQGRRIVAAFGDQAELVTTTELGHRRILSDETVVRTAVDFVRSGPSSVDEDDVRLASAE
ncbi:alpha/beta hydrolase [Streptomyces sp. HSW2009]|uniref:alpha/beta hydrolase n=1 Tax=Streptomyces sp. HSW2009 TaxID=3142890 RepID=UPI0032EAA805